MRSRTTAALVAVVALLATMFVGATPAQADNPHGHWYAQGKRNVTSTAFQTEFHANYMTPGLSTAAYPAHITAEMWVRMSNSAWIEVGIINSYPFWPDNKQGANPVDAYSFFWADASSGGNQAPGDIHTVSNITPDGHDHVFNIDYSGSGNNWNVYIDGQLVGVSGVTGAKQGVQIQWGLELGDAIDPCAYNAEADTFDMAMWFVSGGKWVRGTATPTLTQDRGGFGAQWITDSSGPHLRVWKLNNCIFFP